jgi:hypothetical protein
VVKLVDTSDLKSAAFLHKGRTGSIPVPGTTAQAGHMCGGGACMSKFVVRTGASTPAMMVQVLDLLSVCVGGWIAYQIRHFDAGGFADLRSEDQFLIVIMSVFSALVFGKVYHLWAGGSLGAMLGRVTIGWLLAWMLLVVLLVMAKSAESFSPYLVGDLVAGFGLVAMGRACGGIFGDGQNAA